MRVVITGGSRGFGLALARRLRAGGHRVVVASRSPPAKILEAEGMGVSRCDASDPAQVLELALAASGMMGGVDAWVNNAGAGMPTPDDLGLSDELWMESVRGVVGANAAGVFNGTHCAARVGAGHVFNVYGAGYDGKTEFASGHGVYAATKACVSFYTRLLGRQGHRVHGLIPGLVQTEMFERSCEHVPPARRALLRALSVAPEDAAEVAAREICRIVARDEGFREIDCYTPALVTKTLRWATEPASRLGEKLIRRRNGSAK